MKIDKEKVIRVRPVMVKESVAGVGNIELTLILFVLIFIIAINL